MSNILIVGGSGFLGYYLTKRLKNKNNLYCFINRTLLKDFSLTTIKFNLRNKIKLKEFILKYKINLIINLSSIASVDVCEKFKKKAYKTHVIIPRILSKIAKLLNIKVVHISTDHLFNGNTKTSYLETSVPNPQNYYFFLRKYIYLLIIITVIICLLVQIFFIFILYKLKVSKQFFFTVI